MSIETAKTADQHRADAAQAEQARQESWERSDTDGFMSQWASGLSAAKSRLAAEIVENGGTWSFPALFDAATSELVAAKIVDTRYGPSWALLASDDPRSRIIGWFNPSKARKDERRRDANRAKGYTIGRVQAPARADLAGEYTVQAVVLRADGGFSRDVIIDEFETVYDRD